VRNLLSQAGEAAPAVPTGGGSGRYRSDRVVALRSASLLSPHLLHPDAWAHHYRPQEFCVVGERRRILRSGAARTQNRCSICICRWRLILVPKTLCSTQNTFGSRFGYSIGDSLRSDHDAVLLSPQMLWMTMDPKTRYASFSVTITITHHRFLMQKRSPESNLLITAPVNYTQLLHRPKRRNFRIALGQTI